MATINIQRLISGNIVDDWNPWRAYSEIRGEIKTDQRETKCCSINLCVLHACCLAWYKSNWFTGARGSHVWYRPSGSHIV